MIPVLIITYNRLEYTKKVLEAIKKTNCGQVYIFDNGSTEGTVEYLRRLDFFDYPNGCIVHFSETNIGIAGAMNWFLKNIKGCRYAVKCDNDTILPPDFFEKMLPHMKHADIVQAKHHLLKQTHANGFDDWVKNMYAVGALRFHHFVGGSGIMFKPRLIESLAVTDNLIMGWRQWQREHPEVSKAFATDVEIELLDTDHNGANYPETYIDYYRKNGRML